MLRQLKGLAESVINTLMGTLKPQSNGLLYSSTLHWPLMGGMLHLVQRGGPGRAAAPPSPLDVPNITAHSSTASVLTLYYSIWDCNYLCTALQNCLALTRQLEFTGF